MDTAFKRWYTRNAPKFNEKRRIRYQSDPEYRKRVLNSVRVKRTIKREDAVRDRFRVKEAMAQVGRQPATARFWEMQGYLPVSKNESGHRVYNSHQIELMKVLAKVLDDFRYRRATIEQVKATVKHLMENWDAGNDSEEANGAGDGADDHVDGGEGQEGQAH